MDQVAQGNQPQSQKGETEMGSMFKEAERTQLFARLALLGPPKTGKSHTGLRFSFALAGDHDPNERRKVAAIDTEHKSLSKYQGETHDGKLWRFDVCELEHYDPANYTQVIKQAEQLGYSVLLIDSLSHAWQGVGGALDQVDKGTNTNSFANWKDVTPKHREMVEAILSFRGHVIVTMRTEVEYVLEEQTNRSGKVVSVPKKVGMRPVQRKGIEYEFDVIGELNQEHELFISDSRCSAIDQKRILKPTGDFLDPFIEWLGRGKPKPTEPAPQFTNGNVAHSEPAPFEASGPAAGESVDINGKALAHQVETMQGLAKELIEAGVTTKDAIKAQLAERGYAKLADMTVKEADELIGKMRQKAGELEAAERF